MYTLQMYTSIHNNFLQRDQEAFAAMREKRKKKKENETTKNKFIYICIIYVK